MATQSERAMPALELRNASLHAELRRKTSRPNESAENAEQIVAAQLLDDAMTEAGISNKAAAICCGVSDSLVARWRSNAYKESPSYAQMLKLPASFQEARRKAEGQALGSNRRALLRLIEAVGDLAEAV